MIRKELVPHFVLQSSAQQHGPSSGGGTHFATQAVKLHVHDATILKKCSAVVFADLKAAFYRTVLEYVLGGPLDAASTEKFSRKLALSPQLALQLRSSAAQGTEYLLSLVYHPFGLVQQLIGTGVQHSMSQVLWTWSSRMLAQSQAILWLL